MKGEVHFFRAFHYHNLLRSYGGVPIVDKAYNLDDEMLVSRNSFEETVNFIVQDLERATELLPEVQPDKNGAGATKGARSEEHTSELQSRGHLVCRLLLE